MRPPNLCPVGAVEKIYISIAKCIPYLFSGKAANTRPVELSLEKPLEEVDSSIVSLFPNGINGMLLLSGE